MRHKDPELMKKIYEYAEKFYFSEKRSPSTTEVVVFAGISRSILYYYFAAMNELGMIEYDGKTLKTDKM